MLSDMENKSPWQLKNLCFSVHRCCILQSASEELNMALERSAAGFKKNKRFSSLYCSPPLYLPIELFCFYVCSFAGCFLVLVQSVIFYSGTEHLIPSRTAFGNLLLLYSRGRAGGSPEFTSQSELYCEFQSS